jgi:hypothetical protein
VFVDIIIAKKMTQTFLTARLLHILPQNKA